MTRGHLLKEKEFGLYTTEYEIMIDMVAWLSSPEVGGTSCTPRTFLSKPEGEILNSTRLEQQYHRKRKFILFIDY